jgi:PAS domain S-box-containing protein
VREPEVHAHRALDVQVAAHGRIREAAARFAATYGDTLRRYVYAVVSTFIATSVAATLTGPLGLPGVGLLAFPIGVLTVSWFCGMGPGIVAAIGDAVALAVFFLKPIGSLAVETPRDRVALAAFVMTCLVESTLAGIGKRAERGFSQLTDAVRALEEKYRLIFEQNLEPMLVFDPRTRAILIANNAALATYGYRAGEIQGMRVEALFEPADAERFFRTSVGYGALEHWRHRSKDGTRLEVETRCTTGAWLGGPAALLLIRDVTARQRAEEALRQANEELRRAKDAAEQATRARDRFLMVLSHELRTPLTPALLASAALETRPDLPARVRTKLGMIRSKVQLEATLIDNLLDVARIINGDFVIEREPADASAIVAASVDHFEGEARDAGVDLAKDLTATACIVLVDPSRVRQAATSLIAHAIDAARSGSTVRVSVRDEPSGRVAIGVRYERRGTEREDPARMFDPFERGATPTSPHGWPLGLGMAITKGIAEACGGDIVATPDDVGVDIVMRLPRAASSVGK